MSILQMVKVWSHDFPHPEQAVMLALADHAHDDGTEIRPSINRIAWKTGYKRRNIQLILGRLKTSGIVVVTQPATNKCPSTFAFDWTKAKPKKPFDECYPKTGGVKNAPQDSDAIISTSNENLEVIHSAPQENLGVIHSAPQENLGVQSHDSWGDPQCTLTIHQPSIKETRKNPLPPKSDRPEIFSFPLSQEKSQQEFPQSDRHEEKTATSKKQGRKKSEPVPEHPVGQQAVEPKHIGGESSGGKVPPAPPLEVGTITYKQAPLSIDLSELWERNPGMAKAKARELAPGHKKLELVVHGLGHLWVGPGRNDWDPRLVKKAIAHKRRCEQPCDELAAKNYLNNLVRANDWDNLELRWTEALTDTSDRRSATESRHPSAQVYTAQDFSDSDFGPPPPEVKARIQSLMKGIGNGGGSSKAIAPPSSPSPSIYPSGMSSIGKAMGNDSRRLYGS